MPPNLLPIVSTGIAKNAQITVMMSRPTIEPGICFVIHGQSSTIASVATAVSVAATLNEFAARASATIRGTNSLGTGFTIQPEKIFDLRRGDQHRNAVRESDRHRSRNESHRSPRPVRPITMSITPAIAVHISSPETPNFVTMPATMTTNAPVGPAIWQREPPSAETMMPAMIAV